jgi:hypothetical protein
MAFYFSSDTKALYDTDVFPVASLPANKVEITEAVYSELLTKQNQGYVIKADNSGNPYAVAQGEASATDIKHAGTIATALVLGHVKIGNTMQTGNDGTLDLKDGAVTTAKIVDANVTADKLATDSVTTAKITDANVTTPKIADLNVTTGKIADSAVTTAKIANQNVTTEKLADGSVTEEKLDLVKKLEADETSLTMTEDVNGFTLSVKDSGVTTAKIANQNVTTAKIADANVTTSKIADLNVTTGKIADSAVGHQKLGDDFLFWDPSFESHKGGIEVGIQNSALTNYSNVYCNSKPITILFLKNTMNFVLNNTVDSGVFRYREGNYVLIVNVTSSDNLFIYNRNVVIKQIPSGSASLFACINKGDTNGANSIWCPIS